jgi:hypothetical protein
MMTIVLGIALDTRLINPTDIGSTDTIAYSAGDARGPEGVERAHDGVVRLTGELMMTKQKFNSCSLFFLLCFIQFRLKFGVWFMLLNGVCCFY